MIGIWGANGFIGRHLTYELTNAGLAPALFARNFSDFPFALPQKAICLTGDFTRPGETIKQIRKCKMLVLAVGTRQVRGSSEASCLPAYEDFFDALAEGAAPEHLIYLSSGGAVYGPAKAQPIDETHPAHPFSPYGSEKLAIERLIQTRAVDAPWKYSILRISNPVGCWSKRPFLIDHVIRAARTGEPLTIFGDGKTVRDYFDVAELAQAINLCAGKPGANEIYNVGSGKGHSIHEVVDITARITNKLIATNYEEANVLDVPYNVLDCGKIEKALGWRAEKDLESIVKAMWDTE